MLIWLSGIENRKGSPNENYARELMELFTLGADRGAYTEADVRQLALALTGWRADWIDGEGWQNFRFDDRWHDHSVKTVFGKSGDFDWRDAVDLVLQNPYHASFFVTKLWSYFVPTPPSADTQAALQKLYLDSGYGIRPVMEAILMHPDFYDGAAMVKPPVVYTAGLLRTLGSRHRARRVVVAREPVRAGAVLPAERLGLGRLGLARHVALAGALPDRRLRDHPRHRLRGIGRPVGEGVVQHHRGPGHGRHAGDRLPQQPDAHRRDP